MPESPSFNLIDAQLADGTLDFYTMLGETPDASQDALKRKINVLYSEAQANRDHRNLNRRREYQTLLELIPGAKTILLDPEKRSRYDTYLAGAKEGTADGEFEAFMDDLMGHNEPMEEKTGLLGVSDTPEPRAQVAKAAPKKKRPAPTPAAPTKAAPGIPPAALGGAVAGLILGFLVGFVTFKHAVVPAILLGIILGAVLFVALNKKPGPKVRR